MMMMMDGNMERERSKRKENEKDIWEFGGGVGGETTRQFAERGGRFGGRWVGTEEYIRLVKCHEFA